MAQNVVMVKIREKEEWMGEIRFPFVIISDGNWSKRYKAQSFCSLFFFFSRAGYWLRWKAKFDERPDDGFGFRCAPRKATGWTWWEAAGVDYWRSTDQLSTVLTVLNGSVDTIGTIMRRLSSAENLIKYIFKNGWQIIIIIIIAVCRNY